MPRSWGYEVADPTDVLIGYDDEHLYLAFRCHADTSRLVANSTTDDRWIAEDADRVEFFLLPNEGQGYRRFQINPKGVRCDSQGFAPAWHSGWRTATGAEARAWTMEAAIPFRAFITGSVHADRWFFNVLRYNAASKETTTWAPSEYRSTLGRNTWGTLRWPEPPVLERYCIDVLDAELRQDPGAPGQGSMVVRIANGASRGRTMVAAVGRRFAPDGQLKRSEPVTVGAGSEATVSVHGLDFPAAVEWPARIQIEEAGQPVCRRDTFVAAKPVLDAYLDRSYYSSEETAFVHIDPMRRATRARIAVTQGGRTLLAREVEPTGSQWRLPLAISGLQPGAYSLALEAVSDDGRASGRRELKLLRAAPLLGEAKIDRVRRVVLIDGQPTFVFMLCYMTYSNPGPRTMRYVSRLGFKSVIIALGTPHIPQLVDYLRYGHEASLKVGVYTSQRTIISRIEEIRRLPGVFVHLVVDEPTKEPDKVRQAVVDMRQADPNRVVWVNQFFSSIMGQRFADIPGDIVSTDYYPVGSPTRRISDLGRQVEAMEVVARRRHMPTWMWLASGGANMAHIREPSPEEQTAQVYECALAGATGLVFFINQPMGPRHWQRLQELNREMEILAPALLSRGPIASAPCGNRSVRVATRSVGRDVYVLAVNGTAYPEETTIDLSELPIRRQGEARVLFEDRTSRYENARLRESFGGYERQVYLFERQ